MNGIPLKERKEWAALLESQSQASVMAKMEPFLHADIQNCGADSKPEADKPFGVLVFNMERGVNLAEIVEFLTECPDIQPYDFILANELDDGCIRSGNKNTSMEIAKALGMNYAWGLEFIELATDENAKGYHGNAIFSRLPIVRGGVIRLPEEYNWYFDEQTRIGGRLAVYAEVKLSDGSGLGLITVHLENLSDGPGRKKQMEAVLDAADREFPGMPVIIGGDLNTNTFDKTGEVEAKALADNLQHLERFFEHVFEHEPLLPMCRERGYEIVPQEVCMTRRKPLPDGSYFPLRLDWLMVRGAGVKEGRVVSTMKKDFYFARQDSALEKFQARELSDHNAVWAEVCKQQG